jgi:methionine synthase I (cobalamin-dependent)
MARFALDIDAVNHRVVIADGAMGTMLQDRTMTENNDD